MTSLFIGKALTWFSTNDFVARAKLSLRFRIFNETSTKC